MGCGCLKEVQGFRARNGLREVKEEREFWVGVDEASCKKKRTRQEERQRPPVRREADGVGLKEPFMSAQLDLHEEFWLFYHRAMCITDFAANNRSPIKK